MRRVFKITDDREFEARQLCLEFGEMARFVMQIAIETGKTLRNWWKSKRPTAPAPIFKAWLQLVLASNDIHQLILEI